MILTSPLFLRSRPRIATMATPPISPAPVQSLNSARPIAVLLLVSDLVGLGFFLVLNYLLRSEEAPDAAFSLALVGTMTLILLGLYITDAYRPDLRVAGMGAPVRTFISCVFIGTVLAALSYLLQATALTPFLWRSILLPGLGLFTLWAVLLRAVAGAWVRSHAKQSSCLLLGSDASILKFEQDFRRWNPFGNLVVLADPDSDTYPISSRSLQVVGSLEDLPDWSTRSWSGVVVAPQLNLSNQQLQSLMQLRLKGTPVYNLPNFYEMLWQKLPPALLKDTWFTFGGGFQLFTNRTSLKTKRVIDLIISSLLLAILSPLMLLTAVAIKLESPGNVFYSQLRTGLNGQPFRVYKFRSMRQDAEKMGAQWAQKRDPRITRVGYFLRLMRIDELPQLWNVLHGEMSLIGPRPERPEFDSKLAKQIPYYNLRYLVKPGITGWAQVMYPYGASVEDAYEKLSYDLYYIKNYSIWLDLAIALKTVRIVVLGKGQ